jgi:large subunit ribosomal protein L17
VRHRRVKTKLSGTPSRARAMFSNMLVGLIRHGRIRTTEKRARILRSIAEKIVTRATSLGDLLLKDRSKLATEDRARMIHAMRLVKRTLKHTDAVIHLFEEVAPRYLGRPGGYTRMYKVGFRKGDNAPVALLEFIEAEMPQREESTPSEPEKKKGRLASLLSRKEKATEKDAGQKKSRKKKAPKSDE